MFFSFFSSFFKFFFIFFLIFFIFLHFFFIFFSFFCFFVTFFLYFFLIFLFFSLFFFHFYFILFCTFFLIFFHFFLFLFFFLFFGVRRMEPVFLRTPNLPKQGSAGPFSELRTVRHCPSSELRTCQGLEFGERNWPFSELRTCRTRVIPILSPNSELKLRTLGKNTILDHLYFHWIFRENIL